MIARLAGTLLEREPPRVIIDCGGVGYDVLCSQYTLAALPADGERVVLHIYTQASENKIGLIGFFEQQERRLFDLLITAKNVGPSTAVAILSSSSPRDIATLIAREDVAGLTRIKGVGKKTAELLVVELHEKCELLVLTWNAEGGIRPVASSSPVAVLRKSGRHPMLDSVANALVGMGWRPAEADAAVAELPADLLSAEGTTIEGLLRQALRSMPR
ncbi:MAG: Holliday junction branch migration protein RuvA [Deltaproteobacteria bacterium]|nr:Holliday junction branch migration protein RuvA [Deltaproteobacteria bacterium]